MLVIGITGGVGCGKSRVLEYLSKHCNAKVLLADDVGNLVKEPGQPCYHELVSLLGRDVLNQDGQIHRGKMADLIFQNRELLEKVNGIIHPAVEDYILKEIEEERKKEKTDVFFLEAALLIECGYQKYLNELWYIYSRKEVRVCRLKASRDYSDVKIERIMEKQLSEEEFRKYSQVVIDNSDDFEHTSMQLQKECERLKIWKES